MSASRLLCTTHLAVWRRTHHFVNHYNEMLDTRDTLRLTGLMVGHTAGLFFACAIADTLTAGCLGYATCAGAWKVSEKKRVELGLAKPRHFPLKAPTIEDTIDVLGEGEVTIKDADIYKESLRVVAAVNAKELSDL